ncbi:hypothetical protein P691DRAFT_766763 [Macrolepiota fuliginosa MF-IS2]|uniref:Uncharacterized protein n=1 Tax=Macrolepiota fuliginosa MF-IS2 TaxID=1400762 RepID=A0A9P5WXT9_9AGAR|nr:hypothetical protein P691DRAFT_766763 [Macrolepiota fuliginosa MF-IS2]
MQPLPNNSGLPLGGMPVPGSSPGNMIYNQFCSTLSKIQQQNSWDNFSSSSSLRFTPGTPSLGVWVQSQGSNTPKVIEHLGIQDLLVNPIFRNFWERCIGLEAENKTLKQSLAMVTTLNMTQSGNFGPMDTTLPTNTTGVASSGNFLHPKSTTDLLKELLQLLILSARHSIHPRKGPWAADHQDLISAGNRTYHFVFTQLQETQEDYKQLSISFDDYREEFTQLNEWHMALWKAYNNIVDRIITCSQMCTIVDPCKDHPTCEEFHIHDRIPSSDPLEQDDVYEPYLGYRGVPGHKSLPLTHNS